VALGPEQRERYGRNILVPGLGEAGQERLLASRVLVVGAGGLGSPAALYLAAAGIGHLRLVDSDVVELSNLQRQVLHTAASVGRAKVVSGAERLAALNPDLDCEAVQARFTQDSARELMDACDAVIDGTDRIATKFLINDACLENMKPLATAGVLSLQGQAAFVVPGRTACLRCAVREAPGQERTSSELGILGAVAGVFGSLQALETIRCLAGLWRPEPDGALLLHSLEAGRTRFRTLRIPRGPDCPCAKRWSDT
jgi:molybdopterin/thiamine biosynthesis adenylyltransferase